MSSIDGVLILGFGGPTPGCCGRRPACIQVAGCEAECFVAGILGDNPARMGRIHEVVHHYQATGGGFSPYNELTGRQARALGAELARRGRPLPVEVGFRHWRPWTRDGLEALVAAGCRSVAVLVMAPHQSSVSWDWYLKHAAEAVEAIGDRAPALAAVVPPWWNAPGFIAANADRVRAAVADWTADRFARAALIFTAHAIPQPVEVTSPYRRQFAETAAGIATALGHPQHSIAFQSQPADSRVPWSAPTIEAAIDAAADAGATEVVVQAPGFLVDHTEVLFDLDIEAAAHARARGIGFTRAPCVHDHPAFVDMLADAVCAL